MAGDLFVVWAVDGECVQQDRKLLRQRLYQTLATGLLQWLDIGLIRMQVGEGAGEALGQQ